MKSKEEAIPEIQKAWHRRTILRMEHPWCVKSKEEAIPEIQKAWHRRTILRMEHPWCMKSKEEAIPEIQKCVCGGGRVDLVRFPDLSESDVSAMSPWHVPNTAVPVTPEEKHYSGRMGPTNHTLEP
ncbi:hypothetical protein STEG23_014251, partial [Scotinomys teguina]